MDWTRKHTIPIIVVVAVLAGGGISAGELGADENLATVMIGLTLVVTAAVFAAAIAAAIYAKPAYDEAKALMAPPKLEEVDIVLRDSAVALARTEGDDGSRVYQLRSLRPCVIELHVSFRNAGESASRCLFNLAVPARCELDTLDAPETGHYLLAGEQDRELAAEVDTPSHVSTAEAMLPREATQHYAAKLRFPDGQCPWANGWPMRVIIRGVNNQQISLDRTWWVRDLPSPAAT